jgi:putative transposase
MHRSSKLTLNYANTGKLQELKSFLSDYRQAVQQCIDYIWITPIKNIKTDTIVFDVSQDLLNLPVFLNYKDVNYTGTLSARAVCTALEQAIDIVRSQTEMRRRLLWVAAKLAAEPVKTKNIKKNIIHINKRLETALTKPTTKNIPAALSSKLIDFNTTSKHFDMFIRLSSTGRKHLKLPVNYTKRFKQRELEQWKTLKGILLFEDRVEIVQDLPTPEVKAEGEIVAVDTGISSSFTASDRQASKADNHGHTLQTITQKLSRKKKGSKSFRRAQEHRENWINWDINHNLNLEHIKQLNIEGVNLFKGQRHSRYTSHFAHSLILQKISNVAEQSKVLIKLLPSPYKSQRCSCCGFVNKANRKGKLFHCLCCKNSMDADLNAAMNGVAELCYLPFDRIRSDRLNVSGFFWKKTGCFDLLGRELTESPVSAEETTI